MSIFSFAIPIPVSVTANSRSILSFLLSFNLRSKVIKPFSSVNLTAFPSILIRTWRKRRESDTTSRRTRGSIFDCKVIDFASQRGLIITSTALSISSILKGASSISTLPASIFEISRISLSKARRCLEEFSICSTCVRVLLMSASGLLSER